jgi:membrane-bound lytic murein transglycosylase B
MAPTSTSVTVAPAPTTTAAAVAPSTTAPVEAAWPPARIEGDLDAAALAEALTGAERTIRDPSSTDDEVARAGVVQQLLYRELAARTEIDDAVVAAVGDDVRPTVERVVGARRFGQQRAAARATPTPLSPTLPAWTVVDPMPVDELRALYDEAEAITGVPWYWLAAIHLQETRMGRVVGTSAHGAVGPMQFLPTTWAECCTGDPLVTRDAIIGAATYLVDSGAPDDMRAAVHQYNPNDSYVALVTAYAENLRDQPALLRGYHAWQVFTGSAAGTVRLPIGYSRSEPIDASVYLAANPDDAG